jgi:gamma-glutamylcyclotransferase (GGCT)/AIG2-like uncharacterized protein YtfP
MTYPIFVYGTLLRNIPGTKFHLLAPYARFLGSARIRGRLYDLGEYPGVVPAIGEAHWVQGEVYAIDGSADVWEQLDAYEGCGSMDPIPHEFERAATEAVMNDGTCLTVWMYVYLRSVNGRREIASGDYRDLSADFSLLFQRCALVQ